MFVLVITTHEYQRLDMCKHARSELKYYSHAQTHLPQAHCIIRSP
jgi:hypothetical protein